MIYNFIVDKGGIMRILVAEDEKRLADALEHILKAEKYMVDVVHNRKDALDYGKSGIYDVIVMDVMMPAMDGYQVTSAIRKTGCDTPILMLTAKTSVDDKVEGLDVGADDYMTKPFSPKELLARIRALTRRKGEPIIEKITCGDLTLDLNMCVLYEKEKSTKLSFKEFELMKLLMAANGHAVSKEDLLLKVWGYEGDATENNVEAYVSFLRKKLTFICSTYEINSIRKIGYILEKKL